MDSRTNSRRTLKQNCGQNHDLENGLSSSKPVGPICMYVWKFSCRLPSILFVFKPLLHIVTVANCVRFMPHAEAGCIWKGCLVRMCSASIMSGELSFSLSLHNTVKKKKVESICGYVCFFVCKVDANLKIDDPSVCLCVCPSEAIPRKLLKHHHQTWHGDCAQTRECITC